MSVASPLRSFVATLLLLAMRGLGAEFHVAPSGAADGDGSAQRPWDLATALAQPAAVKPGDTLWLHGGTYRGSFESTLKGTAAAPIVVRQARGERATISLEVAPRLGAALSLKGEHTRYQGFEVTNANPRRRTDLPGSWPADLQRGSVDIRGHHVEAVNLIVHDLGVGVGFWSAGDGGVLYGCLIFNNGWLGPDRGHGHAVYSQNERGTKRIEDCIFFQQFGHGLQVYGSAKTALRGYSIAGNIAFSNGSLAKPGSFSRNILAGGEAPLEDVLIEDNLTWHTALQIGYPWGPANKNVMVRGNYLHGQTAIYFPGPTGFHNNTLVSEDVPLLIQLGSQDGSGLAFSGNSYYQKDAGQTLAMVLAEAGNQGLTPDMWKALGRDVDGTVHRGRPAATRVFVRPNRYEPGRAHLAVYNWARNKELEIDLGSVLANGQRFRIVNARAPFGPSVVAGSYDGSPVRLPITPCVGTPPVGMPDVALVQPEPEFGAYLVLPE